MSDTGIYGRIAVRPHADCPIRRLSEQVLLREFVPGRLGVHPPQIAIEADDLAVIDYEFPLTEVVEVGDSVVCRLPDVGPVSIDDPSLAAERADIDSQPPRCEEYGGERCLAFGFSFLPIEPYALRWEEGWLHLSIAARSYDEIQHAIEKLNEWRFDVDLKQIVRSGTAETSTSAVVTLDSLTDRQRQVARLAVRMGYFDSGGASAEAVATELGISKSTVSKHLRAVVEKLLSQIF
jgi:DNA-binding CsgD family transcriptional regulator